MCLALIAWQCFADTPLVVGFNRDEFFSRPTDSIKDRGNFIGGLDLVSQGTWLAVKHCRFSAVTNLRNTFQPGAISRGQLVREFVSGNETARDYVEKINYSQYSHFNLILCDGKDLVVATNPGQMRYVLSPGFYTVTNNEFDGLACDQMLDNNIDCIFQSLEQQHVRKDSTYGTRSSTVVTDVVIERTYDYNGFIQNQLQIKR